MKRFLSIVSLVLVLPFSITVFAQEAEKEKAEHFDLSEFSTVWNFCSDWLADSDIGDGQGAKMLWSDEGGKWRLSVAPDENTRRISLLTNRLERGVTGSLELAKMESEARQLGLKARRAEGEEHEELEASLHELLNKIFVHKQEFRAKEIEVLRAKLAEASNEHDERENNRGEIIKQRFDELLGRASKYAW